MREPEPSIAERVDALELFAGCSPDERAQVVLLADEARVPSGHVLIREGTPGREAFILLAGTVDLTQRGRHVGTLATGAVFGELSLLDRALRVATATAVTDVAVLVLPGPRFEALLELDGVRERIERWSLAHRPEATHADGARS